MVLNLNILLRTPLGEEISQSIMAFVGILLALLIVSKILNLKDKNLKTILKISIIIPIVSFLIRSISIIFSLKDTQKPIINISSMVITNFLFIILIKKSYSLTWFKTLLTWILASFGKLLVVSIITMTLLFCCTSIMQEIEEEKSQYGTLKEIQDKINFEIKEPAYIPKDFYLDNVFLPKNSNGNYVSLHYSKKGNSKIVIGLDEELAKNYKVSGAEEIIMINGNTGILTIGLYNDLTLTWYSDKLDLLFNLKTSVDNNLINKEELIKIARSI